MTAREPTPPSLSLLPVNFITFCLTYLSNSTLVRHIIASKWRNEPKQFPAQSPSEPKENGWSDYNFEYCFAMKGRQAYWRTGKPDLLGDDSNRYMRMITFFIFYYVIERYFGITVR